MLSILEAVWQGRTIDLPPDKERALVQLACEIGADALENGEALAARMLERERGHNCGIGCGVATPHVASTSPGELTCAVGWCEEGIEYGACNGRPVHLVVMYRIPEAKRPQYLEEMAAIARAIKSLGDKPVASKKDRTRFIEALIEDSEAGPPPSPLDAAFRPRVSKA